MLGRLNRTVSGGRGRSIVAGVAAVVGLAVFAVGHAATETVALLKVRMGGDSSETRTVIELDGAAGKVQVLGRVGADQPNIA